MKKNTTIFLGLLLTMSIGFAQNSKLSASVSYPITVSDDFFDKFSGILDLGLGYDFYNSSKISVGASLNANLFTKKEALRGASSGSVDQNLYTFQPRGFVSYGIGKRNRLKPFFGLGYSIVFVKVDIKDPNNVFNGDSVEKDNKGFLNLNFGVAYDVLDNLFLIVQFDHLSRSKKELNNFSISDKMEKVKLGIGYRF